MRRTAIFLDVDGTLVNDHGVIPDSAREAVRRARANDHLVFLCTGRSMAEVFDEILDVGVDGVIAAAGGYVEVDGRVLLHQTVPVPQVRRATSFFRDHGTEYLLEANAGLFGSDGFVARVRELVLGGVTDEDVLAQLERAVGPFLDTVQVPADPARTDINKIAFLHSAVTHDEVRAALGDTFTVIPGTVPMFGPNSGELSLPGIHKATAIAVLLDDLGIDVADTIAYGDGHNDLEMLEHVAIGVAMGNAVPELRAVADEVTAGVDEHGLLLSFRAHGLA